MPKCHLDLMVCTILLVMGCSSMQVEEHAAGDVPVITPALQADYLEALDLMQGGEWGAARQRLETITASHPQLSGPWLNLGIAQLQLGDSGAAETAFKRALEANPSNAEACNQLGVLYRSAGRMDDARRLYEAALLNDPESADAHWNLGTLHDQYFKNPQQALLHYERYQTLTGSTDPQLQARITDLRSRLRSENVAATVKP